MKAPEKSPVCPLVGALSVLPDTRSRHGAARISTEQGTMSSVAQSTEGGAQESLLTH